MNRSGQVLLAIVGLLAVGLGLWELRNQMRLRRFGVRSGGVVLRHDVAGHEDGTTLYVPVIGFCDEHGVRREFRSRLSGTSRKPPAGSPVPVVYLPGRPETARMDSARYRVTILAICFTAATVCLTAAVLFRPS